MANTLGIKGYDFVEFYVGSAKAVAYWHIQALGMECVGYRGPETGSRERCSYVLEKNRFRVVVTSSLDPANDDVAGFVRLHGDGAKRWAATVDDVGMAFGYAVEHGAVPVRNPEKEQNDAGVVESAAIKLYDDAEIVFIDRSKYDGIFRPGFGKPPAQTPRPGRDSGLQAIDHIVGNVRQNEMDSWSEYFVKALDFENFIYFGPGDISTQYSALLSRVVRSKDDRIKNPINEPYEGRRKSQIEEFIQEYRGTGIQHVAVLCRDICQSIASMREAGVSFLTVPDTYYDALRKKQEEVGITESIDDLQEHGILCDTSGKGYLLQLFTQPIGDRPTFFYEFIQRRKGAEGFGQGNFQALFESIEAAQAERGNL